MSQTGRNKEEGSVLVMAVVLSFALFVLGLSYLSSVENMDKMVSEQIRDAQNIYGLTHNRVTNMLVQTGGQYPGNFGGWNEFIKDRAWYRDMVSFNSVFQEDGLFYGTARGYGVYTQVMTSFYGSSNPLTRYSVMYEILETFADYLYLSSCEEDPVRADTIVFWTPDTLDGKVHSNDTIRISATYDRPRFMKKTTSCAPYMLPIHNNATFDEGFFPNADSIYFPDQAEEVREKSYRNDIGTLDPDSVTEITFNGQDIIIRYCGYGAPPYQDSMICNPIHIGASQIKFRVPPAVGALFVRGKVYIKASRGYPDLMDSEFSSSGFAGKLTIACSDTMIIYDNLIYEDADQDNSVPFISQNCLGLISEKAIMIGDSVRDTVYVNAALASIGQSGTISVRDIYDYGTVGNPNDNEKQSLFIYGSLAMKNRGIVHTSHNNWGVRGFIEKDYHYDTRFQTNPPPHFIKAREHNSVYREYVQ